MSTSYSIFHTDGLALHFVNREQAAAWAVAQPVNSKIASLFLAFQECPFDDGSIVTVAADATLRMFGGWTFIARFGSDNPNPVLRHDAIRRFADAMSYDFETAATTLSQLGYLVDSVSDFDNEDWEEALLGYDLGE